MQANVCSHDGIARARTARGIFPVSSAQSLCARPTIERHASICCATRGLVGAMKSTSPSGHQRRKLYITAAAMKVFPRPVGRQTSVFLKSASETIACWYVRSGTLSGYTQLRVVAGSSAGRCISAPLRQARPCAGAPGTGPSAIGNAVSEPFAPP